MKKLLILLLLAIMPILAFSQTVEPPADLWEFWEFFKDGFATWPLALGVIMLFTEKIKRVVNATGNAAVILSYGLAIPLTLLAWFLNLGFLEGIPWYIAVIYAISFSLAANLAYLAPIIKEFVRILIDYIDKRKLAKYNN